MANIVSTTLLIKNTNEEITSFLSEVISDSDDYDEIEKLEKELDEYYNEHINES